MRSFAYEPRALRLLRELPPAPEPTRIKGYAIAIDFLNGDAADARLMDKSPALFPERAVSAETQGDSRRRFGFVEFNGEGAPPRTGVIRQVGDAFFADRRTAEFVWQAIIEKIESDAVRKARVEAGLHRS